MGSPVNQITGNQIKNYLVNGGFNVNQRKSSPQWLNLGNLYTSDCWFRFKQTGGNSGVFTQIQDAGLGNGSNSMRFGRMNGSTDLNDTVVVQVLETQDTRPLAGSEITLSFKVKKGVSYSGGNSFLFWMDYGTGVDQGVVSAWTGQTAIAQTYVAGTSLSTSSYYQASVTVNLPANATQLRCIIQYTPSGTAGSDDYVEITEVMLNKGKFSPYVRYGLNAEVEKYKCMQYYQKSGEMHFVVQRSDFYGACLRLESSMRTAPVVTLYSTSSGTAGRVFQTDGVGAPIDRVATATSITADGQYYIVGGTLVAGSHNIYYYTAEAVL